MFEGVCIYNFACPLPLGGGESGYVHYAIFVLNIKGPKGFSGVPIRFLKGLFTDSKRDRLKLRITVYFKRFNFFVTRSI